MRRGNCAIPSPSSSEAKDTIRNSVTFPPNGSASARRSTRRLKTSWPSPFRTSPSGWRESCGTQRSSGSDALRRPGNGGPQRGSPAFSVLNGGLLVLQELFRQLLRQPLHRFDLCRVRAGEVDPRRDDDHRVQRAAETFGDRAGDGLVLVAGLIPYRAGAGDAPVPAQAGARLRDGHRPDVRPSAAHRHGEPLVERRRPRLERDAAARHAVRSRLHAFNPLQAAFPPSIL